MPESVRDGAEVPSIPWPLQLVREAQETAGSRSAGSLRLTLTLTPGSFALCFLPADGPAPSWAAESETWPLVATREERLVALREEAIPDEVVKEGGYRALRFEAFFDVLREDLVAALAGPLAADDVEFYICSAGTWHYVLLPGVELDPALATLARAGHEICLPDPAPPRLQ